MDVKFKNGRTILSPKKTPLGNVSAGTLSDDVIIKSQLDALQAEVDAIETGSETLATLTVTGASTFGAQNTYKGATSITAFATGGQGSATALTGEYNEITVCATAGDSVVLSTAVLGKNTWVKNAGANYADVFPATGGTIDGGAANAAFRLQPGQEVKFKANSATAWVTNNPGSGRITQATDITTGVTLNTIRGVITTQAATAGASGATPNIFTVTNSFCQADSHVAVYIMNFTGTGNPVVIADNRTDGTFDIQLSSCSAAALNNAMVIGFEIKN